MLRFWKNRKVCCSIKVLDDVWDGGMSRFVFFVDCYIFLEKRTVRVENMCRFLL